MAGKNKEVFVKFDGDSRGLVKASKLSRKELDEISRSATNTSGKLTGMASGLGTAAKNIGLIGIAAGSAAAVGFAYAIKSTIDLGDKYAKLSQKVNVSVESLSTLDYAAKLSGTSIDVVAKSLLRVSSNLLDADRGLKESVDNFAALGIETKNANGELRDADEILIEVADRFASMEDGTQKTALAMKLFGKSGAELIPLLNQGSDGIRAMTDEARGFGLEISTKTAKESEIFNDNLSKISASATGVGIAFTKDMIGPLNNITDAMVQAAKDGGILYSLFIGLGGIASEALAQSPMEKLTDKIEKEQLYLDGLITEYNKKRILRINPLISTEELGKRFDEQKVLVDKLKADLAEMDSASNVLPEKSKTAALLAQENLDEAAKAIEAEKQRSIARELAAKATDKAKQSLDALNQSLAQQAGLLGEESQEAMLKYRLTLGDLSDQVKAAGPAGQTYADAILAQAANLDRLKISQEASTKALAQDAADKLNAASIIRGLATEEGALADAITEVNLLVESGMLSADIGAKRVQQLTDEFDALKEKTKESKDQFADLTSAVNGWGSDFADAMLSSSGSFTDFANNIIKQMAKIAIQQLSQPTFDLFGGFLKSAIGDTFGGSSTALPAGGGAIHLSGAKALGGPVSANEAYLVGENGPEIIMPRNNGMVIPNNQISKSNGSSSVIQNISIDARGAQPGMEQKIRAAAEEGARKGYMMVLDDVRRNGAIRGALR